MDTDPGIVAGPYIVLIKYYMKINFNDFYKKGGYSNPFRYFESSTFKQAEEKTEMDAFSILEQKTSGISFFFDPNINPHFGGKKK